MYLNSFVCILIEGGLKAIMYVDDNIAKLIRDYIDNKKFKLSSAIGLETKNSTLVLTLSFENVKDINMQYNPACFEGWAVILKTYVIDIYPQCYYKVQLSCPNITLTKDTKVHLMRFLYRVLRFSEQYDWFTMDDELADVINSFKPYLQKRLVNNYPKPQKIANDSKAPAKIYESTIEFLLLKNPTDGTDKTLYTYFNKIDIPNNGLTIDHQLPVGLFIGKESSDTRFFPGGAAAIDLWGFSNSKPNDFYIFELKYKKPMIGTITEAFFYANYMHDLLHRNGAFSLSDNGKDNFRNYSTIYSLKDKDINRIHAVMLLDKNSIHPAITPELLAVLNQGSQKAIEYSLAEYEFDEEKRIITDIVPK